MALKFFYERRNRTFNATFDLRRHVGNKEVYSGTHFCCICRMSRLRSFNNKILSYPRGRITPISCCICRRRYNRLYLIQQVVSPVSVVLGGCMLGFHTVTSAYEFFHMLQIQLHGKQALLNIRFLLTLFLMSVAISVYSGLSVFLSSLVQFRSILMVRYAFKATLAISKIYIEIMNIKAPSGLN